MSAPPPILGILTAGGFGVRLEHDRLIVSPADAITAPLRDLIRAAKPAILAYLRHAQNRKRATPPSAKSVKTPEKGSFGTFGTTPPGPFSISRPCADPRHAASARLQAPAPEVDIPRRLWLIHHPDGGWVSHSFCPPASLKQVRAWYLEATIAPEDET